MNEAFVDISCTGAHRAAWVCARILTRSPFGIEVTQAAILTERNPDIRLTIRYQNLDHLEGLVALIKGMDSVFRVVVKTVLRYVTSQ